MVNKIKERLSLIFIVLSHVLGIIRTSLVSYLFGSSVYADILSYSFSYPNQARKKMEEGTGNLALISRIGREEDNSIPLLLFIVHIASFILVYLFAPLLSDFVFSFTSFTQEGRDIGRELFKSFLIFLVLYSFSLNLSSYLIVNGKKSLSAFLVSIPSLSTIIFLLLFCKKEGIYSFSDGLLCGGIIYLFFSLIFAIKNGMRLKLNVRFDPSFVKSFFISIFLIFLSTLESAPFFIAASRLNKVSVYFNNSYVIFSLAVGLVIEFFTIAAYPDLVKERPEERRILYIEKFKIFSFLSVSIALLMYAFSSEIVSFLYLGGSFTAFDAERTSTILKLLSPSVITTLFLSFFERVMFIEFKSRALFWINIFKIASSYVLLFLLPESTLKSALIIFISTFFSLILSLFISSGFSKKKLSLSFFKSIFSTFPIILLLVFKRGINLSSYFENKIELLLVSLSLGAALFLLSVVIFIKGERTKE